jgi:hypothetical protein
MRYELIYRQIGRGQPKLIFLLLLNLGSSSESDLDFDSLPNLDHDSFPICFVVWFNPDIQGLDLDRESYPNST